MRDSVRPESVEGPSATTSPACPAHPQPSIPRNACPDPDTVPEPTGAGRCAIPFALSLSKGPPQPPAPARPALPPPSYRRKPVSRAGARCGAVSASPTSHTRHRRTGESRYPEVRRAAAHPHQPTSQARFEPSPFALSLSKGPPQPSGVHFPRTLTPPPRAIPHPPATLSPCTTRASTPATSPRPRECRSNQRKRSWKYPKTHSCWTRRVVSAEGSFVGDSFPSPQKAH